jgi:lysophospholipase L1-like esterase
MNVFNQFVAYLFASGDTFFLGLGLIVFGRATTGAFRSWRGAKWLRLLTVFGVIIVALSVVPLPWWLYGLSVIPPVLSLNVPFRSTDSRRLPRLIRRAQPAVELLLLMTLTAELLERRELAVVPLRSLPAEVQVIGDSLSAGIENEQERLWPNLLANTWNVTVRNHAQAGATTSSALRQADAVASDNCLVLIEIGGNDFFEGRRAAQIETDWNRLLTRLSGPRRTLVMFELPLPPLPGAWELARLQRRLAHRYSVRLIPRREFARVLLAKGTTSDGLHLTELGHRQTADLVLRRLTPNRE